MIKFLSTAFVFCLLLSGCMAATNTGAPSSTGPSVATTTASIATSVLESLLVSILTSGTSSFTDSAGQLVTIASLTNQVNKTYGTSYSENQVMQIAQIIKNKNVSLSNVIQNSLINAAGNLVYTVGE